MKKILLILMVLVLFPVLSYGASPLTFAWDANTEPDLAGYKIYQADRSGGHIFGTGHEVLNIPVGTTTGTILVVDGTWFFVVTAYDFSGNESGPSNELTDSLDSIPPNNPSSFRKITIIIKVE